MIIPVRIAMRTSAVMIKFGVVAILPLLLLGACAEWPAPRTETNRHLDADRYWREQGEQRRRSLEAERFRQEREDFQRRQRAGR
jgi:hypothetical protein